MPISYLSNQGQLYVMGGSNGHSDELSCGETYNPTTDEWTQVPELRTNRCNAGKQELAILFTHAAAHLYLYNNFLTVSGM